MANNVWLISNATGSGVNYYLSGGGASQTPYTGSGTPWTAQTTTPYELSMNDVTGGIWTPTAAPHITQLTGGSPFAIGQIVAYSGWNAVTETIGVQMRGTTHDNAVALLRQLRQILNSANYTKPCILAVQPNNASNIVYFNIFAGDVQETPHFLNQEVGQNVIRATITIVRSSHGGRLSTGETVLNGITLGNNATGSPDNINAYGTGSGELIYEGSPLNIVGTMPATATNWSYGVVASADSVTRSTTGTGTVSISSTTGTTLADLATADLSSLISNAGLKLRILAQCTLPGTGSIQANCYLGGGTSGQFIYASPWIRAQGTAVSSLYDFGSVPLGLMRPAKGLTAPTLFTRLTGKVSDGVGANFTFTAVQYLYYYTFAKIDFELNLGNADVFTIDQFPEQSNYPCLPYAPRIWCGDSAATPTRLCSFKGTLPRYFRGASYYQSMMRSDRTLNTSDTFTMTGTHAALFHTLRGDG